MRKLIITAASAIAVMGLAACSDTDETTTQSIDPAQEDQMAPATPEATPTAPADDSTMEEQPTAPAN